jgi:hypothetical protein
MMPVLCVLSLWKLRQGVNLTSGNEYMSFVPILAARAVAQYISPVAVNELLKSIEKDEGGVFVRPWYDD